MTTAMSPEEAATRAEQGGTLLCLDSPCESGTFEFGIDCTVYTVGPKFQAGLAMARGHL
jgi:hypothetical protein